MTMRHELNILRVYDLTEETCGFRILTDRLWPRGFQKDALRPDRWAKEVAPSTELRKWFGHADERFEDFKKAYRAELDGNAAAKALAAEIDTILDRQDVLLLYAAKSPSCNHAVILRDWLLEQMIHIVFEKENRRAAAYDGKNLIGSCQFAIAGGGWIISHTEVRPEYGGRGIAKRLVECVSDESEKAHAHLTSVCPYATKVLGN